MSKIYKDIKLGFKKNINYHKLQSLKYILIIIIIIIITIIKIQCIKLLSRNLVIDNTFKINNKFNFNLIIIILFIVFFSILGYLLLYIYEKIYMFSNKL